MPARRFNETDIDFEAIEGDLAKLAPPKLSLKDVLDRLRDRMVEQRAKGVTVAQMHEVLKARGIEIGERSLKDVPRQGRASGTQDGEVRRAGSGNGVGQRSVLSAMVRSAVRERAISLEER